MLSFITLCLAAFAFAQVKPIEEDTTPIKVDTTLVTVPVMVSDENGRSVKALDKRDFSIVSNGIKREIDFFADIEEPVVVAIVLDTSGSVTSILDELKVAAKSMLSSLRPVDRAIVATFDHNARILQAATSDTTQLERAIDSAEVTYDPDIPFRVGSFNDAFEIIFSEHFLRVEGRKAVIVFTDSGEFAETEELTNLVASGDVPVYPIFYPSGALYEGLMFVKQKKLAKEVGRKRNLPLDLALKVPGVQYLNSLATLSGGRLHSSGESEFASALTNIMAEIRKQYVIGFHVDGDTDASSRDISVTVNRPGLTVRTKQNIKLEQPAPIRK